MKGPIKNMVGWILQDYKTETKKYLSEPQSKSSKTFVDIGDFINENLDEIYECVDAVSDKFVLIKHVEESYRMPHVCW